MRSVSEYDVISRASIVLGQTRVLYHPSADIGGVVVFGGGLPLYDGNGIFVGRLGVSGDTACADHVVAWKVRHGPQARRRVAPGPSDNLIFDIQNGVSSSGLGHPPCKSASPSEDKSLNHKLPVGPHR